MNLVKDSIKLIQNKPKLIVFDLDRTLWDLGIDEYFFNPPYSKRKVNNSKTNENNLEEFKVYDCKNKEMKPFLQVKDILNFVTIDLKIEVAAASRTTYPPGAYSLLELYGWSSYFKYKEIYPGCKLEHFQKIKNQSKINYKEIIFFDDEYRNIYDISKIGVTCIKIDPDIGMNYDYLKKGFDAFANKSR